MRFIATVAILAGTLSTVAYAQGQGNAWAHVDVSGGLAVPASKSLRNSAGPGTDLLIGFNVPLSPFVDWRLHAGAILFVDAGPDDVFQSSSRSMWADPVLSVLTGPRIALSPAPTHMYLQGSVGVLAFSPAFGVGVGIRNPRVFGEITYTDGLGANGYHSFAYASFRFGVALGSR